jgi:hypothetical protein
MRGLYQALPLLVMFLIVLGMQVVSREPPQYMDRYGVFIREAGYGCRGWVPKLWSRSA